MNKRGQIYLLAALIISAAIYSISTTVNYVYQEESDTDFETLSETYEIESSKLINTLLSQGEGDEKITEAFNTFTLLFTSYSKSQNPSYGLIYSFAYEDKETGQQLVQVGNYLDKPIIIDKDPDPDFQDIALLNGCFEIIPATLSFEGDLTLDPYLTELALQEADINACTATFDYPVSSKGLYIEVVEDSGENTYYFLSIKPGQPQITIITRLEEGRQRKIFIGGEGFLPPPKAHDMKSLKLYCYEDLLYGGKCDEDCCEDKGILGAPCIYKSEIDKCVIDVNSIREAKGIREVLEKTRSAS